MEGWGDGGMGRKNKFRIQGWKIKSLSLDFCHSPIPLIEQLLIINCDAFIFVAINCLRTNRKVNSIFDICLV